jgi:amino-acid N-acetyltransferase
LALTSREGKNVRVASGNVITAKPLGVIDGVDFQYTGEVRRVDINGIQEPLNEESIVLVSPLGFSPTSEVFNLRCEEIATEIATNIKADKLILLTEGTDLIQGDHQLIRQLTTQQAEYLANQSRELSEMDDAALHLQEAISASKSGVHRVHLIDRHLNGGLLIELFTRYGAGTLISAQPFEDARPATVDDIHGILDLIKPLEQRGLLTPRSPETIELDINKFYVIKQDGLVTTCAALYPYPDTKFGELACVAVHPDYRTGERGEYLLKMIENKALSAGLTKIFVLTTQSSHWFIERGFKKGSPSDLPPEKREQYNDTRRSQVLIKTLL